MQTNTEQDTTMLLFSQGLFSTQRSASWNHKHLLWCDSEKGGSLNFVIKSIRFDLIVNPHTLPRAIKDTHLTVCMRVTKTVWGTEKWCALTQSWKCRPCSWTQRRLTSLSGTGFRMYLIRTHLVHLPMMKRLEEEHILKKEIRLHNNYLETKW